jgi:chromosomal replication initiation ATPase DnaA
MRNSTSPDAVLDLLADRGLLELVDNVCALRGVTRDELCGRDRSRAVAAARHELWALIYDHRERFYSFAEIGRFFGRDHTSVIHGIAAHRRRTPRDLAPPPPR